MAKQITFDETKRLLEKGKPDTDLLKMMDAIMGLAVFFAPTIAGLPPGTADIIVEVLGEREALIKAGERIIEKLSKIGTGNEIDKYRRIQAAHLLTVYSAFFDSVSNKVPGFWKKLALDESAQKYLAERSTGNDKMQMRALITAPLVPHPLDSFESHLQDLRSFYETLSQVVAGFLESLKIVNIDAAAKANEYASLKQSIVDAAIERYQAQYIELAKLFPEFYIFANFHFQVAVGERLRGLAEAGSLDRKHVDVGFQKLADAIEAIGRKPAEQTMADLRRKYEANSRKPVWAKELQGLTFPRRSDIFIPQAYRAVRYKQGMRLDSDDSWRNIPINEDLGPFITRCLESPYSLEKPILVLGQPGSGKSMLTHMVGSVLGGHFDTVRVELRNVQADARIYSQIEEFVCQETQGRRTTWPELRNQFTAPPVVILDGFDELLQATGKIFAAYLQDCAAFQSESADLGRPVRMIITSRIALVNRAHIPEDTIVIRLEEFDAWRQKKWVDIWNSNNHDYFDNPGNATLPFELKKLHKDIQILARQPLLLLMLAIYDIDKNRLAKQEELNRTALYHNLIYSFVEREEARTPGFEGFPPEKQDEQIITEMRRLGVAGLSMFNRRKRDIKRTEVEDVLSTFQLRYPVATDGHALGQAERLFGRFFFVLKAETAAQSGETAYEFLHATFAEFLAAYTIACEIVENCENVLLQKPIARRDYVKKPDTFPGTWFECLMHAPIFNEPVVLSMLREWLPQAAGARFVEITQQLEAVVIGQTAMLLEGGRFPDTFKSLPVLGHAAIYSSNLVTIVAAVKESEFVLNERDFQSYPDETRPWDRLTYLWRSWFSLRILANLGTIISAKRDGDQIRITATKEIREENATQIGLDRLYSAARGLGDNVLLGLSGYFLADSIKNTEPSIQSVDAYLEAEGYSLGVFSKFRKIPLEHSSTTKQELLAIVEDARVPNWEVWVRAIWILTSHPLLSLNWTRIPMIRELHKHCDHLVAAIASPEDSRALFSELSDSPVQLIFAKHARGEKVYKQTFERLLLLLNTSHWSELEYITMADAAARFGNEEALRLIGNRVPEFRVIRMFDPKLWPALRRHLSFSKAFVDASHSAIRVSSPQSQLILPGPIMDESDLAQYFDLKPHNVAEVAQRISNHQKHWILRYLVGEANPYQSDFARILRTVKANADLLAFVPLKYLTECVGLPSDVQIELLDIARITETLTEKIELKDEIRLSSQTISDLTLESLPSAKAVALWLDNSEVLADLKNRANLVETTDTK